MAEFILQFVSDWSSRYVCHLDELPEVEGSWRYKTTWSIPTQQKPVPKAVCFIYFRFLKQEAAEDEAADEPIIQYKSLSFLMCVKKSCLTYSILVENESFIHSSDDGVRFNDAWLDNVIRRKMQLKPFLDLRDDFDKTRLPVADDKDWKQADTE